MYIFLAVAAIYTLYIFHSKYLNKMYQNNQNENINDTGNDVEDEEIDLEPKEVRSVINKIEQEVDDNNEFIDEKKSTSWFWQFLKEQLKIINFKNLII